MVPPEPVQVAEYWVPGVTDPPGVLKPMLKVVAVATLNAMVCDAVCAVGVELSVTVAVMLYELGGAVGSVPVKVNGIWIVTLFGNEPVLLMIVASIPAPCTTQLFGGLIA